MCTVDSSCRPPLLSLGLDVLHDSLRQRVPLFVGPRLVLSPATVGKGSGGENTQPFECHYRMMTQRGIWNMENLDFSQLVADKAYEFLFDWSPLKIKGGTGSPGNPVALY